MVERTRLCLLLLTGLLAVTGALLSTLLGPGILTTPAQFRDPAPQRVEGDPRSFGAGSEESEGAVDEEDTAADEAEGRPREEGVACPPASPSQPCPKCPESEALQVETRRRIARAVADVQGLISRVAGTVTAVDGEWALRLGAVAAELDPRLAATSGAVRERSARLPGLEAPWSVREGAHVCPEAYFGPHFDAPFNQHGMEPEACQGVPPFASVLTALLPAQTWSQEVVTFVVAKIRKLYDIPIIVVASDLGLGGRLGGDARVLVPPPEQSLAEALNDAVGMVETPFVLLGESLAHFSNQSSLERLVRVLDDLDHVQVAGGAARDAQGHWSHGCLQQHMANYQAKYTMGYYHSKYECMYCDDLLTPFVTTTKLLRSLAFSAGLSGQALYRDWFAKVRGAGHLAVLCPDVMFFVSDHVNMTADDWLPVARRWALQKVQAFDGREHLFSCESVGISCRNPLGIIQSYLLPPCCVAEMEELIEYLVSYAEQNHLDYELHAGSVLGAIKLGQYLPWDFDTDIVVNCHQFNKWMQIDAYMKATGMKCRKRMVWKGYMNIICPHFFLEIICHEGVNNSRIHLPAEYRDIPTQALYSGRWVNVRSNPGLYCRNAMGLEVLRHAAHWRTLKTSKEAKARGGYDDPGTWNKCKDPSHHSCLDKYPGDGNLPFTQPFLRP